MPASFEEIDFRLRPAKQIERKMICDALHRLTEFAWLDSYRYVGFGGIYFSEFVLFHKQLGIEDMISIERETDKRPRFGFNAPYKCITMKYGEIARNHLVF